MAAARVITEYLNVDLELVSSFRLDALIVALDPHVHVLRNERMGRQHVVLLEYAGAGFVHADANLTILRLTRLVLRLPEHARRQWDRARSRTFDIGIQAGTHPAELDIAIASRVIRAVSAVNGRLKISIYSMCKTARCADGKSSDRLS